MWKRNKNSKMLSFCVVFNSSNRADREKYKSNYSLPLIFQEIFNWEKARKNKNKNQMLSASPSSACSHKVHNIKFEKHIIILS